MSRLATGTLFELVLSTGLFGAPQLETSLIKVLSYQRLLLLLFRAIKHAAIADLSPRCGTAEFKVCVPHPWGRGGGVSDTIFTTKKKHLPGISTVNSTP